MLELGFIVLSWLAVTSLWIGTKYKEEDRRQRMRADEENKNSEQSEHMYDFYKERR